MGVGDLSFSAVASLKSIDLWIATINSNMAGAGRVGYKATRVKFDGGVTQTLQPTVSPTLGVQVGEQTLGVVQTTLDFSQGAITASTEFTHFAIQQSGASVPMFVLNTQPDGSGDTYYTRDGEFHFDTSNPPLLVNSTGLYVMSQDGDAISFANDGDANAGELNVTAGTFSDGTALPGGAIYDEDVVNGNISLDRFQIQEVRNPQLELRFSRFGSTIFEPEPTAAFPAVSTPNADGDFPSGRVIPNSLEASNANLTASVPELSLAQKMYTAITKVIQVSLSNVDASLQLIR